MLASIVVLVAAGSSIGSDTETTVRGTVAYEVFSDSKAESWIEALDLASGRVTRLTEALPFKEKGTGAASDLAWSPDGTKLAFIQHIGYTANANLVKVVDVTTRRVTDLTATVPNAFFTGLAWSPDGKSIAFSAHAFHGNSSVSGIYLASIGSSATRRLTRLEGDELSWSPKSDRIAFVVDSREPGCDTNVRIGVKTIAGGTRELRAHRAGAAGTYTVGSLAWRPSGQSLLYVSNDSARAFGTASWCDPDGTGAAAFVVDPSRKSSKRLVTWRSGSIADARWSPTGRSIALHRLHGGFPPDGAGVLQLMMPAGHGRRTLASPFRGQFAWARSGGALIETGTTRVLLRDVSTGRVRELARWETGRAQILAVGRQAVAVRTGTLSDSRPGVLEHRITVARLSGGGSRVIVLEPPTSAFRLDGDVAAFLP